MIVVSATNRNMKICFKIGIFLMFNALQTKSGCYNNHRTDWVTNHQMKIRYLIFKKMLTCNLILGILIQHSSEGEGQRSLKTEQE